MCQSSDAGKGARPSSPNRTHLCREIFRALSRPNLWRSHNSITSRRDIWVGFQDVKKVPLMAMAQHSLLALFKASVNESRMDSALVEAAKEVGFTSKQRVFRRALEKVGCGKYATNTTAWRREVGAAISRALPGISFGPSLPSECIYPEKIFEADTEARRAVTEERFEGLTLLRSWVDPESVRRLRSEANQASNSVGQVTQLRPSTGNGAHGAYAYFEPPPDSPLWQIRDSVCQKFNLDATAAAESRCVLIRYGLGGVNFLHQDQCALRLQATILLSRPGLDFTGGEFFVQPANGQPPVVADCRSAGDVVVFEAANGFAHGILPVKLGAERCQRFAIGLFQPPDTNTSKQRVKSKRRRPLPLNRDELGPPASRACCRDEHKVL